MLTIGSTSLASWEVATLRQTLAPALTFTKRYHRQPYCLATLPTELGARVEPFREDRLTLPAFLVARDGEQIVRLNAAIIDTPLAPLAVVHECSHHLLGHRHAACTAHTESRQERDVWLASALVAVSDDLTRLLTSGQATAAEIALRCRVPEPLVMVRAGLAALLDGRQTRQTSQALETIRYWLARLEVWIDSVRRQLLVRAVPA